MDAHPFAECYPKMSGPPLKALAESIKKDGQQLPITRWGKLILDGRCRFAACQIAGIEPEFVDYDGDTDPASLMAFVRAANEHRRHLNQSELARAAEKLVTASKGPRGPFQPISIAAAAAMTGASVRSTKRAIQVTKKSVPEVQQAVEQNEVTLTDAAAIANKPPDKQRA